MAKKECTVTPPETKKIIRYIFGGRKWKSAKQASKKFNLTEDYIKNIVKEHVESLKE
jgi:hypothetical protein